MVVAFLLSDRCSMFVVCCALPAARCSLFVGVCNVCLVKCSLFDAGRLLSGVCSVLLVAVWLCVLFVVRCLLFAVCVWTC